MKSLSKYIKTRVSKKYDTAKFANTTTLEDGALAEGKNHINKLPYDILSVILEIVHHNVILTKSFVQISVVCKHWRTLSRINGQTFRLDSFFVRAEEIRMRVDVIERCFEYITTIYPSLEDLVMSSVTFTNTTYLKNVMFLVDKMQKISRIDLGLYKSDAKEFGLLCGGLKVKRGIKSVTVDHCSPAHLFYLVDLLEHSKAITSLTVTNINLEDREDANRFHTYLSENSSITELTSSFAGYQTLETFKEILAVNPRIKTLRLQCLPTSTASLKTPSRFVYPHQTLTTLSLSQCDLNNADFEQIALFLGDNHSITTLDLSHNKFVESSSIDEVLMSLQTNPKSVVSTLGLAGINLNDRSMRLLGGVLETSTTLVSLDLSDNLLRWTQGFVDFSKALGANRSLTTLFLNRAKIHNSSFASFVSVLAEDKTPLTHLELSATLNQATGNLFGTCLKTNTSLCYLDVSNCDLLQQGGGTIGLSLMSNRTLLSLNLSNTKLHNFILLLMSDSLRQNQVITSVDLSNNYFSSDALGELLGALKSNNSISRLNLQNTGISKKEVSALTSLLEGNSHLAYVDISSNNIPMQQLKTLVSSNSQSQISFSTPSSHPITISSSGSTNNLNLGRSTRSDSNSSLNNHQSSPRDSITSSSTEIRPPPPMSPLLNLRKFNEVIASQTVASSI
eukprot:gene5682-6565_t